jgi:site-specific DNA-methyltransferase (cytosine-N4-specific)
VRREKNIRPGDTFRRFAGSLGHGLRVGKELTEVVEQRFACQIMDANVLDHPAIPRIHLVVSSPPYPNAYSYHLYHKTRMLWLGMDQPSFKEQEIGSHRKYSSKSSRRATIDTFRSEMEDVLSWLRPSLAPNRYACFVVGDSTIQGRRFSNAEVITEAAYESGFRHVACLPRAMQETKKAFNPRIGKIKTEQIVILQKQGE